MAKGGTVNFDDIKRFRDNLEKNFNRAEVDKFIESCAKELAARLLAKVVKRTPVGNYSGDSYTCAGGQAHKGSKISGKVGGTLRRGWTGGKSGGATAYAQSLKVNRFGDTFVIEIINPVEYATYVEFGHRTRNHKGWVEGHFMLSISEGEIKRDAPKILEKKLKKKLEDVFK